MNLSGRRLQGFSPGSPERVVLTGIKKLLDGKNLSLGFNGTSNAQQAFVEAASVLIRSGTKAQMGTLSEVAHIAHVSRTGPAHMRMHHHLLERGFDDISINSIPKDKVHALPSKVRTAAMELLPHNRGELFIILARRGDKKLVLLY